LLSDSDAYLQSARQSLDWLAARQDKRGGWRRFSAFSLDGAQCVFEGFNTYQNITGERHFEPVLIRAADRMVRGTLHTDGALRLANIIELGEYAHFALLAWKTTGARRFRKAAEDMLAHIGRNFDAAAGMWRPFDSARLRHDLPTRLLRPILRFSTAHLPLRGKMMARISEHLAPLAVIDSFPQYAMSLMDAEALIDTLDGTCDLPRLYEQTRAAVAWAESNCSGPISGSLVESADIGTKPPVFPVSIINDTRAAALWPSTCLLIAYCGLNDDDYISRARGVADWILAVQDESGGFSNFQNPDGSLLPLQSGNVNFYASMALWLFNEVYNDGRCKLFTRRTNGA